MKVEKRDLSEKPKFGPFELVLRVESEAEARALYAIFNYTDNCQLLGADAVSAKIRDLIGGQYGQIGYEEVIAHGVRYRDFYVSKAKGAKG